MAVRRLSEVKSSAYPGLDRSKKENWVDKAGGLPSYIERIAKHLHYEKGKPIGHAIAIAVNVVKKMCATGDTNFPGKQNVNAGSKGEACAAVASWEAKKARSKGKSLKESAYGEYLAFQLFITPQEFQALEESVSEADFRGLADWVGYRLILCEGLLSTIRTGRPEHKRRANETARQLVEAADGQVRDALEAERDFCRELTTALNEAPVGGARRSASARPSRSPRGPQGLPGRQGSGRVPGARGPQGLPGRQAPTKKAKAKDEPGAATSDDFEKKHPRSHGKFRKKSGGETTADESGGAKAGKGTSWGDRVAKAKDEIASEKAAEQAKDAAKTARASGGSSRKAKGSSSKGATASARRAADNKSLSKAELSRARKILSKEGKDRVKADIAKGRSSLGGGKGDGGKGGKGGKGDGKHGDGAQPQHEKEGMRRGVGMVGTPSEDVKHLQRALRLLGIPVGKGGVDGRFGPDTERALRTFQQRHGMKATGVIDRATRKALNKTASEKHARRNTGPDPLAGRKARKKKDDSTNAKAQYLAEGGNPYGKGGDKGEGMKRCPSCGMRNAKGKTKCFKCHATLAKDGDAKLKKADDKGKVKEALEVAAEAAASGNTLRAHAAQARARVLAEGAGTRASSSARAALKRLPDGTFAPKGQGQVLKRGDKVSVPHRSGRGNVKGTMLDSRRAKLDSGPDKGTAVTVKDPKRQRRSQEMGKEAVDAFADTRDTLAKSKGKDEAVVGRQQAEKGKIAAQREEAKAADKSDLEGLGEDELMSRYDEAIKSGDQAEAERLYAEHERRDSGGAASATPPQSAPAAPPKVADGPLERKPTSTAPRRGKDAYEPDENGVYDVGGDVNAAADLLAEGKHVKLSQPREVSVLLDELAKRVNEAKAQGEKAPDFDLCKLTVPDTNLFCAESKGVPRNQMPQLSGKPIEGSRAHAKGLNAKGEADITEDFRRYLESKTTVEDTDEKASYLRATQTQLNGGKVAGMTEVLDSGGQLGGNPRLFVSRDNYIVDGHHRWAANVGHDLQDGTLGDVDMPVQRIDMDIMDILSEANNFAEEMGIPQAGI